MVVLILKRPLALAFLGAIIFFIIAFLTLKDYGISWDEALHFRRGQAYLHYFLTGKLDYSDLPKYNLQGTGGNPQNIPIPRRSFYQDDFHNGHFFLEKDSGHPPLNGEFAALFNYILFQKLGILDDISSHHIFNVLVSAVLVFIVVYFVAETFDIFTALVVFLTLITYPLFFSESHFNVKDPALATFFTGAVWAFFKSIKKFSWKWLSLSFIFFALGLGTKFNILFIPLIFLLYFFIRYLQKPNNLRLVFSKIPLTYKLVFFLGPIITILFFIITWPYLWRETFTSLLNIVGFYQEIGLGERYQPDNFFIFNFNIYPILWILFTTPPVTLFLIVIGIFAAILHRRSYSGVTILWLIWFVIPIVRVTLPGTTIYGGIRQIMEFLPAMSLLAGLGAWHLIEWAKKGKIVNQNLIKIILISSFLWQISILVKLHPNQNVYFNQLIGGLTGAKERSFPSWGNSFGNAYLQGIKWINQNVEPGAKLSLIQGTYANVPIILLRSDIDYKNSHWSGTEQKGEYLMDLIFNDSVRNYNYTWEYVDKFLNTVWEFKVDNVTILKIWKNDLNHTKLDQRYQEKIYDKKITMSSNRGQILLETEERLVLSNISIFFNQNSDCILPTNSFVETSLDKINWIREKDWIPFRQVGSEQNLKNGLVTFWFAGKEAKYIRFLLDSEKSCLLNNSTIQIKILLPKKDG